MTKTIKKVTTVVPVLMTSCHVSEKWKIGPENAQNTTMTKARINAEGRPVAMVAALENL